MRIAVVFTQTFLDKYSFCSKTLESVIMKGYEMLEFVIIGTDIL